MSDAEFMERIHEKLDRLSAEEVFSEDAVETVVNQLRAERLVYETERALREVAES